MSGFSEHYKYENEHGVACDPGIHTVGQLARLVNERQAKLVSLAPEAVTVRLRRVAAVDGSGYALVPLSPIEFTPSHKSQMPSRFAKLDLEGAALLDSFFEGTEAWRLASDAQVYGALLLAIEAMAAGAEGEGAGYVYRGTSLGGAAVGGTFGWDADETRAETPLDRTVHPRSGFLSRVVLPLCRLVNLALLYRRGAGSVRLEDVPIS